MVVIKRNWTPLVLKEVNYQLKPTLFHSLNKKTQNLQFFDKSLHFQESIKFAYANFCKKCNFHAKSCEFVNFAILLKSCKITKNLL